MLSGKVVIVTGGAKGIGRYAAKVYADAGAKLSIWDIAPEESTTKELQAKGVEVLPLQVDVRNEDQVRRASREVTERFGRIDVLLNNAGLVTHPAWTKGWGPIMEMEKSFWDRVIETNLTGSMLCTKHVLPQMIKQRSGHIINVHGGAATAKRVGACAYMVTKDALRTFTRFVAEEVREHGVCVVIAGPGGAIATEEAPDEVRSRMPGPDLVGTTYLLAAEAPMEFSGFYVKRVNDQLQLDMDPGNVWWFRHG
ncbi:MAG: SDR family NAD(P)-dependent oxidoreductase [Deltaproteobacteria bacterium]|nr:SDR family NAD(P)-dependent oxidoreductase [Deltaproteobacteria bacterium]